MPPKPPVKQFMQSLECNWYIKKFVHITMSMFAKTAVYGSTLGRFRTFGLNELLHKTQPQTRKTNGLLTISNHTTYIDDPLLWAAALPMSCSTTGCQRWSLAAEEVCFFNDFLKAYFTYGQGISVMRGNGIYQHGINLAIEKLREGVWVHIFPEGKVVHGGWLGRPFRWGTARMLVESTVIDTRGEGRVVRSPGILPLYHEGTPSVFPTESFMSFPTPYNKGIDLVVGEEFSVGDIILKYAQENPSVSPSIIDLKNEEKKRGGEIKEEGEGEGWLSPVWEQNGLVSEEDFVYQKVKEGEHKLYHMITERLEEHLAEVEMKIKRGLHK